MSGAGGVSVQSGAPPQVVDVHVSGAAWSPAYKHHLWQQGLGHRQHGYVVNTANQFFFLSWVNVDRITVRMTHNMAVDASDLRVRGGDGSVYSVASADSRFDTETFTTTATFTLADGGLTRPNRLTVEVDGDPGGVVRVESPMPLDGDGDNLPGGDFVFRMTVVPGSVNGGGPVDLNALQSVRRDMGTSTANPGQPGNRQYTFSDDVNGDGRINVLDLAHVRSRLGTYLPRAQPTASGESFAVRIRPATRDLFGNEPVLT